MKRAWPKILTITSVVIPLGVGVFCFHQYRESTPMAEISFIVALTLGLVFTIWFLLIELSHKARKSHSILHALSQFSIDKIADDKELEHAVRSLYASKNVRIFATHIEYKEADRSRGDFTKDDWAKHLYEDEKFQVPFNRIVSVSSQEDRDWVRRMVQGTRNLNYDLRVLEVDSYEELAIIPYPNYVIIEKYGADDGGAVRIFMSFRGATPDASGRFAFLTSNAVFGKGLLAHASQFHAGLPCAELCVQEWQEEGI